MLLVLSALLEKSDRVILSDPHYVCYPNFIQFVQGVPVTVPVDEEDGFQYRPEAIEKKIGGTLPNKVLSLIPKLDPLEQVQTYLQLMKYVYPQLKAIELTAPKGGLIQIYMDLTKDERRRDEETECLDREESLCADFFFEAPDQSLQDAIRFFDEV